MTNEQIDRQIERLREQRERKVIQLGDRQGRLEGHYHTQGALIIELLFGLFANRRRRSITPIVRKQNHVRRKEGQIGVLEHDIRVLDRRIEALEEQRNQAT